MGKASVHDPWALPVADPLDACRMLWKVIHAMMAPVIGTDADVDGSDQAAYLRYASDVVEVAETYMYLLFMSVVAAARRLQSGPPGRLPAVHANRPGRHHRCGDRARLMPSLMSDLDGNRLAQGLPNG